MAIQSFKDGGFYGKVGKFVGERFKGGYMLRTWAKTPRHTTEPALLVKSQFQHAVELAQQALIINKGDPSWDTSTKPEFGLRVGTAMRRIRKGLPDSEALPLYPDGYAPVQPLGDLSYSVDYGQSHITLTSATKQAAFRRWRLLVNYRTDINPDVYEDVEMELTSEALGSTELTVPFALLCDLGPQSWISGITIDNQNFGNEGYEFSNLQVQVDRSQILATAIAWPYALSYDAGGGRVHYSIDVDGDTSKTDVFAFATMTQSTSGATQEVTSDPAINPDGHMMFNFEWDPSGGFDVGPGAHIESTIIVPRDIYDWIYVMFPCPLDPAYPFVYTRKDPGVGRPGATS